MLVRDIENGYLTLDQGDQETLDELRGHSTPYRIALGPHAGRKALTLQTLPRSADPERPAARANGFSLHAGVVAAADQRAKLERLCRYITRPAVSTERLSLTAPGYVHYRLKTPSRDGTTHVVFEPLDKIVGNDFEQPQAGPVGVEGRTPGIIHRQAGGTRAQSTRQPDPLPRCVRAQPSSARARVRSAAAVKPRPRMSHRQHATRR